MEHKVFKIGLGDDAIHKTVETILRLARRDSTNKLIINIAKILSNGNKSNELKARSAFDFVKKTVKYKKDSDLAQEYFNYDKETAERTELVTAPIYLLETKKGDCDDMTTLLACILTAMKIKNNIKIIAWKSNEYSHVYNEVLLEDNKNELYWVPADVVHGTFGNEVGPLIRYEIFKVN